MQKLVAVLKTLFAISFFRQSFFTSGRRLEQHKAAKLMEVQATRTSPSLPWGYTSKMVWGDPAHAGFTDANILAADGRCFAVHRAVLAAASPVFRKDFSERMRVRALVNAPGTYSEGTSPLQIGITDATADVIESMLAWIYSGKFDESRAAAVLPLARRYELADLADICISSMARVGTSSSSGPASMGKSSSGLASTGGTSSSSGLASMGRSISSVVVSKNVKHTVPSTGVKHIVMLGIKDEATPEQIESMYDCVEDMQDKIPEIKHLESGIDLKLPSGQNHPAGKNRSVAFSVWFNNDADYEVYAKHPEHLKCLNDFIKPILSPGSRAAIQYKLG